nr:hypothetical protein [Methylobacterium sp.]
MMNFILGTVAGGLVASIAIIAAARHPEVQSRLGITTPAAPITLAAPSQPRPECPCLSVGKSVDAPVGQPEMLFSRRRFWSVAPH